MSDDSMKRVAMAKVVALQWIRANAIPEYRLTIYQGPDKITQNLPNVLKSFRDGKVRLANLSPISDLGIQPEFDFVVVKSKDYDALQALDRALCKIGCETSGVY